MNRSSGIKRGLAATAISALAVTGLPFLATSASAVPMTSQYDVDEVQLLSQFTGNASVKNDGQNTTVRLEAGAGTNVSAVTFQYQIGAGPWIDIQTVSRNDDGAFSYEWNATSLAGATVNLRAQSVNATTVSDAADDRNGVVIAGGGSAIESVNLNDGSALGVFQAPYTTTDPGPTGDYAILSGTASAAGAVDLFTFNTTGDAVDVGDATATVASGATTATFTGIADINGYDFTGSPDEVALGADIGTDSDDVEAFTLYQQAITTVTATPKSTSVPAGGGPVDVTIKVTDQNDAPIANAEVRDSSGALIGYTNANGQFVTTQGVGTKYYYANATDSNAFEPEVGDKRSADVTITQYTPAATSLAATSRDGAAFDLDENDTVGLVAGDDITVQVKDQNGNNINADGQTLNYYWVATPFSGGTAVRYPSTGTTSASETGTGLYKVAFPQGGIEGTYELFASLSEVPIAGGGNIAESKVLTVKAGEAEITYDEASPETATAGGQEVVDGQLVLDDGTGLPGRKIDLTLQYNGAASTYDDATPDAVFLNDNGTLGGTTKQVTTGTDGSFAVTVKDSAETPQLAEIGDNIDAVTAAATTDSDNPGASTADHGVNFLLSTTAASVVISNQDAGLESPGEVESFTVTVMSGDQDPNTAGVQAIPLAGEAVALTTDHGYFTDGNAVVTAGGDQGVYDNDGQAKTVTTNGSGVANFKISMGRDEGFDDDGLVTSHMTATAGSLSDTQDQDWSSATPLNGGEVRVEFSPDSVQESGVLPKAPITDIVWFDVFAEDQFGNLVGGEDVTISDNTPHAGVSAPTVDSNFDSEGDFYASSNRAVNQTVTGTWVAPSNTYNNATPPAPNAPTTETLTDSQTVEWYEVDFANSTYAMTSNAAGEVPVGTTVIMTYTATDQNGEPIEDLWVEFFRAGPGNLQDGDGNFDGFTGEDGTIQYIFQGESEGNATVTAIGRDGGDTGEVVPNSEETESVTFVQTGRVPAGLTLRGGDNGAADDSLFANAIGKTEGAVVKLFRKRADGTWKLLQKGIMNRKGNHRFEDVNDKNGNKVTRYKAVVKATELTKRGVGKKKVR